MAQIPLGSTWLYTYNFAIFRTAVMDNIFSTIKGNMASKPEYTYNFAIITERNGVSKPKSGYEA